MPKIATGAEILNDISAVLKKEFITTNGIGGYASSTLACCNTRRYHGLLVTPAQKQQQRTVVLSKLEESIRIGHRNYYLSTNKFTDNYVHPMGYVHLRKYEQAPFPRFIYTIGHMVIVKEIFMVYGEPTTIIRYRLFGGGGEKFNFVIHPLTAFKDFHQMQKENHLFCTDTEYEKGILRMKPYEEGPVLKISAPGMNYKSLKNWFKNFQYEKEKERGLDYVEDLFNPGYFYTDPVEHFTMDLVATCNDELPKDTEKEYQKALKRIDGLFSKARTSPKDPDEKSLALASDMHVVKLKDKNGNPRSTIVAGYHWFGDWGRDTFISLPGLTLSTGRYEEAKEILQHFAQYCVDGLIPNRFGDLGSDPIYNTVDASLWFINSAHLFAETTGDLSFIRENLYETLKSIIDNYSQGTNYGIGMDSDGLIRSGEEGMQLTWMDAKIDGWVVTERSGKPVEINALWYNALKIMQNLAGQFGDKELSDQYGKMAQKTCESFNRLFWNEREGYLYDCIGPEGPDSSFRPNQIFAVSLPFPVLAIEKWNSVVSKVYQKLYTPTGLRSLDPDSPNYRGSYTGTLRERDSAYHMGISWGWLLGPFIEAYLKAGGNCKESVQRAKIMMDLWTGDLLNGGLNTLSEIYDGDEPFSARGCISQAWSIAEALRIKNLLKKL